MASREPEQDNPEVRAEREETIWRLRRAGLTERAIAERVNLSPSGVHKVIARVKQRVLTKAEDHCEQALMEIDRELCRLGFSNISDYVMWGPGGITLRPDVQVPEELAAAIAELRQTESEHGGSISIKLHDKLGALNARIRLWGLAAPEKREISGPGGGPIQVADPRLEELLKHDARELARMHSEALARSDAPQPES